MINAHLNAQRHCLSTKALLKLKGLAYSTISINSTLTYDIIRADAEIVELVYEVIGFVVQISQKIVASLSALDVMDA